MAGNGASGSLEIAGDRTNGRLFFEDGCIVYALPAEPTITGLVDETARDVVDHVLRAAQRNTTMEVRRSDERCPIATTSRFDVAEWFGDPQTTSQPFGVYRLTRIA